MELFPNQEKKYIKDLLVGDRVDSHFKIVSASKRSKRDGGFFLTLELMDKTGQIAAKLWEQADRFFRMIKEGDVYKINGYVNEYQGKKEIKVDGINPLSTEESEVNPEEFSLQATFDTQSEFSGLMALIRENLTTPPLQQLLDLFEKKYGQQFSSHYGAQRIHHAYPGGLLKHTAAVTRAVFFMADEYSLNKEILAIGALFHDIGKLEEFTTDPVIGPTSQGGLVGHIVIGHQMFQDLKRQIVDFPLELALQIEYMIVSHHGEKEFGSPELPKTREAVALYIADLLDSRLAIFDETIKNSETKGAFTDYLRILERRLYIPETERQDK